ncbi:hypothetical protein PV10_00290 [Exophiala mesophila]|uniref:Amidohydrolase-related domain-containing protein n=1 Tax=Exophiala mesophila TaxID=212818 RepID=A0A0D2ABX2_EXOME|nr:uncharacterized protein PV10_00290 [Exophiala mesophila]KIV96418.1 hypothetical protein PV10_00290 [Exophiala mesophila]
MANKKIPLVALEEYYFSKAVNDYYESQNAKSPISDYAPSVQSSISELGPARLTAMTKGRITLQVICHHPNTIAIPADVCRASNDELHAAISSSPDPSRFAALAVLPTVDPTAAAEELRRCVNELHFVGSMVDNTTNGSYYDDASFWPIFAVHELLDVPLYLHSPSASSGPLPASPSAQKYPPAITKMLTRRSSYSNDSRSIAKSTPTTTQHILHLFLAGVFDTYPGLKLIIGHMGTHLASRLERNHRLIQAHVPVELRPTRHLLQVWHSNLYITTSHTFNLAAMSSLTELCCADKVLYSVGWPTSSCTDGLSFMRDLRVSGLINDEDFDNIAYRNAVRLLGLRLPKTEDGTQIGLDAQGDGADGAKLRPWLSVGSSGTDDLSGSGAILTGASFTSAAEFPFPHSPLETVNE